MHMYKTSSSFTKCDAFLIERHRYKTIISPAPDASCSSKRLNCEGTGIISEKVLNLVFSFVQHEVN